MRYQLRKSELFRASLYLTLHEAWKRRTIRFALKFLFVLSVVFLCLAGSLAPLKLFFPAGLFYLWCVGNSCREYAAQGVLEPVEFTAEKGVLKVAREKTHVYPLTGEIIFREYLGILFLFWNSEGSKYFLTIPVRVFADPAQKLQFVRRIREEVQDSMLFAVSLSPRLRVQRPVSLKQRMLLIFLAGAMLLLQWLPSDHKEGYTRMSYEEQLSILEELDLTIPAEYKEKLQDRPPDDMEYIESDPFYEFLTCCGMPKWDPKTYEVTGYSEQTYWFDLEGFDISTDYIEILKGVQALAGDLLFITDLKEDTSGVQWEEGTGDILISFRINGRACQYKAKMEHDWIDSGFLVFLKETLDQERGDRHLYSCPDNGQGCILFYREEAWAKDFETRTGIPLY